MKKINIYLIILSLLFSSFAQANEAASTESQDQKKSQEELSQDATVQQNLITHDRYVSGAVLGSVVGFGVGHWIQSRPSKAKPFIFMFGEIGVVSASVLMYVFANTSKECTQGGQKETDCINERNNSGVNALKVGALAFVSLRVWEVYDLWSYSDVQPEQPKVPKAALYIHPGSNDQVATSFILNF